MFKSYDVTTCYLILKKVLDLIQFVFSTMFNCFIKTIISLCQSYVIYVLTLNYRYKQIRQVFVFLLKLYFQI